VPEATACPPFVVAETIMRTIELGVTITDAAVEEKVTTSVTGTSGSSGSTHSTARTGLHRAHG
jgi:hypothetical protein